MLKKEFCTSCFCFICVLALFFIVPFASGSTVSYNWDNGTLQGWTLEPVLGSSPPIFGGSLYVDNSFNNSAGSMAATDTLPEGLLLARAPEDLSGDLSVYAGIQWDEYIPNIGSFEGGTYIILRSTDGTMYESDRSLNHGKHWYTRFQAFDDPAGWSLIIGNGTSDFMEVVTTVEALFISMDTTLEAEGAIESWVDNVTVPVPLPSSVFLLSSALATFIGTSKRKKN